MATEKKNVLLGALIQQRRIDKGMTQEELGGNLYSRSQISRIEKRFLDAIKRLLKLARRDGKAVSSI